ncbi:hypothetical protein NQ315_007506 [Exocentrus adspersus]|uniref:Uncharacterized protein n=1 Tax=Exocentrus adspersus TaxID=1586481 RepID=A0AAV8W756_9CUCU|nr:hypothetical protein NQ315_007506 [Exocentrus adspersus]
MRQGMSYSCKEKTIILNVFKYFRTMHPDKCVTEIVRRTAKATGCSEKSVFQFRKEEASAEGFKEPSKTKIRKNININSRFIKYDGTVREAIRNLIYDLKYRNIVPSLSTLLKNINANEKLPTFSIMTLRRLLRDMGFYYEKDKTGNKAVLVDGTEQKSDIKKNSLSLNNSKKQSVQPPIQSTDQNQTQPEVKSYPFHENVHNQSQMYTPTPNHHRHFPVPVPLAHQDNTGLNHAYMPPNMVQTSHQIHGMQQMPPASMKPPSMGWSVPRDGEGGVAYVVDTGDDGRARI